MSRAAPEVHRIDPARLAAGSLCNTTQKQQGEGDVHASYSADTIDMHQKVRRPFIWQGQRWVCTGIAGGPQRMCEVYRLVPAERFRGTPTTYSEKTRDSEAARNDPLGFYHGMQVQAGGKPCVLEGPPVRLVPGEPSVQHDLFSHMRAAAQER